MKAIPEGTVLAIPLETGGWALGVVARLNWRAYELVVYALASRFQRRPLLSSAKRLSADQAIYIQRVSNLAVRDGSWEVLGLLPGWQRSDWPMPVMVRRVYDIPPIDLVQRSDLDPTEVLSVTQIDEDIPHAPCDRSANNSYFETILSRRINGRVPLSS